MAAYDSALPIGLEALGQAVARNLYRESPPSPQAPLAVAAYLLAQASHLAGQPVEAIMQGRVDWISPTANLDPVEAS